MTARWLATRARRRDEKELLRREADAAADASEVVAPPDSVGDRD